ncbi:hypothetical protein LR48_Vigan10g183600 [Vigna angularis]|uniref:Uncharacterized protein n=1 Tax=Phaseolus angularis TaxID=3914 RepID=A0A0L9VML0_PHAAN|nr:hypothetical protein LR48_Vigan10g183600 [Vigna angularis]
MAHFRRMKEPLDESINRLSFPLKKEVGRKVNVDMKYVERWFECARCVILAGVDEDQLADNSNPHLKNMALDALIIGYSTAENSPFLRKLPKALALRVLVVVELSYEWIDGFFLGMNKVMALRPPPLPPLTNQDVPN